ncbi:MAG: DUF1801 domain-containing protein [Myxococcaceae bacterium]
MAPTKKQTALRPNPQRAKKVRPDSSSSQQEAAVVEFLRELDHPLKSEIEAVRQIILGVSPEIREGIKWNAPSFRTTDFFATFHLRNRDSVRLILHTGAKVKASAKKGVEIADPAGLLEWLADDRCMVTFVDAADVQAKRTPLKAVIREWIARLPA